MTLRYRRSVGMERMLPEVHSGNRPTRGLIPPVRGPFLRGVFVACVLLVADPVTAGTYVSTRGTPGSFHLAGPGQPASLCASSGDHPGVLRVLNLLREDMGRVSGSEPSVIIDSLPRSREFVLVGTLGRNPLLDRLVKEGKLDIEGIAGKWETFLIQSVEKPFQNVDRALVIAGSDRRGTIYGMFDLSSAIGVSPWYWWADVTPRRQPYLFVLPGRHSAGEPKVKYRGIFINDEAPALAGWAREKFGGFNHRFYEHVFELLLRLKANYLWPAMWGSAFYDDDPENPRLANEYGIVIGTSHHEPMMRAHDEWRRYGSGPWNYTKNDSALREFWREGVRRMGSNESIVTVGMRGDGDEPMSEQADIALLERIVRDQREILAEESGKNPAGIPQVWALYKEVQEYYDRGMRVPDDVTLLLCDDNWGNLRRLPPVSEGVRPGGYGIYYHFDYVGGPRNYKWLNTVQIARVWEQMHLAYEYGARQIWIVNVGDIKPLEFPTQFFLEYAWDPGLWNAGRLPEYARRWAEQQFGSHAGEIAEILTRYTTYNSRRKPELLSPETYSLTHYREAETVVHEYNRLAERARAIQRAIPPELKDAYYGLVLHPVLACANLTDLYVTVGQNRLYARQGRAATNRLAARAKSLFERDSILSYEYNRVLAGGKWDHMMDQTHIGYTTWQQPEKNLMPRVDSIDLPEAPAMGVAVEGSDLWWPGDTVRIQLPAFDCFNRQSYYIDLFNRGRRSFRYSAIPGEPWLKLSPAGGVAGEGERILATVDWSRAPRGHSDVSIAISGPGNARVVVHAAVENPPGRDRVKGFVESNGHVSIEAGHYSAAVEAPPVTWVRIPDLGRTLSAMTTMPVRTGSRRPGGANPRLEYTVHLSAPGEVRVGAWCSPTLDVFADSRAPGRRLRLAISFDSEEPQVLEINGGDTVPDWRYPTRWMNGVSDNIRIVASRHVLSTPGEHVLKFWMVDPGVILQKLVVERGELKRGYLGPPESFHAGIRETKVSEGYSNPVMAGFYPDPSLCRAGKDYYLVNSTFSYFPGLPIFHSRDLVSWKLIGHVLDRPRQLNLDGQGVSRGLFAPAIRFHDGVFYVTCTLVDIGGNFVVTATNPRGPWTDPVWLPEIDGIDPSLFFGENGKSYILYNSVAPENKPLYSGHRTIRMREFDTKNLRVSGEEWILVNGGADISSKPVWVEGPHLFREGEYYYLIAAEGGTGDRHSEVVFRSRLIGGPYIPFEGNPILTQRHLDPGREAPVTSAGHADFVRTEDGTWWAVFLACRPYPPYAGGYYNTGRETFLAPIRWSGGWPVITTGDEEIAYRYPYPITRERASQAPCSGNFAVRHEFEGGSLDRGWMFLRTPHEKWYDLVSRGYLGLKLRPETCSGTMNPSFLGRRQQHLHGEASTALIFSPTAENEKAGLLVFQNETHFYFLCKSLSGGRPAVELYRAADTAGSGSHMELIASRPIDDAVSAKPISLKIEAHDDEYTFFFAFAPGRWRPLGEGVDAKFLSTKVAGGLVGCVYALYATSLGKSSDRKAYYDWFEYSGEDRIFAGGRR